MKISEMTNDQAAEALIRLAVPFGSICEDEEAIKMIEKYNDMKNEPVIKTIGTLLPQLVAYMFKTHKNDLYEIVGALTMKSTAAVAKMNFMDTIKTVRESYDEVLHGFFTSSASQIANNVGKSSTVSSDTDTTE